ncbi:MAG: hypothetical protein AMJ91_03200 [candidate division Zixibacteria bacterium SM23_73_3]|nr:MAG: hypothetical protein AMJ91_03200 [candidate division Zixibacteria bacterium SM23_73_3]
MRDPHPFIRLTLTVVALLVWMVLYSSSTFAQKDPLGKPDTCRIVVSQDEKSNQVTVSAYVFNDEELMALTLPFRYGDGKSPIRCDSVRFWKTRTEYFGMKAQKIDTIQQTVLIGLISDMGGDKPALKKGYGEVAKIYFTLSKDKKFQDFYMDTTRIKPFNVLKFVTPDVKGIYPAFDNSKALVKGGIPLASSVEKKETEKPSEPEEKEKK